MNDKITITIPAYTNKPNKNGTIYDKQAIKKAVKKLEKIPIVDRACTNFVDGIDNYTIPNITMVGIIEKAKFKKRQDVIKLNGRLMNAGLNYILNPDTGDITFTDLSLLPFGEKGE